MNKIENDEKYIYSETFREYFGYQNPSFLAKDLHQVNQAKNEQALNQVNDALFKK